MEKNEIGKNETKNENDFLANITLEYLMKKDHYAKYIEQIKPVNREKYLKERKFYKKRIYDFTKKMLNGEKTGVLQDVVFAFEKYIRYCVEYFKMLDKTDILQEDYSKMDTDCEMLSSSVSPDSLEENDQLFMRSFKVSQPNSLEKIVKRTTTKVITKRELPKQKEINLKDPVLKQKGIKKNNILLEKNNIKDMYGDHQKKDENKTNENKSNENKSNEKEPNEKDKI
jgi:hypothetical protein